MQVATVSKQTIPVHVRWFTRRDMAEVMDIEGDSFEYPWSESDFIRVFHHCIGMVAEHDEQVAGYMIYELHAKHLDVLNFAVAPRFRRQGVGAALAANLVSKLSTGKRNRITLEIRDSNLAGHLFFQSQGFRAVGVRRDAYEDTSEDAYLFQYRLSR